MKVVPQVSQISEFILNDDIFSVTSSIVFSFDDVTLDATIMVLVLSNIY